MRANGERQISPEYGGNDRIWSYFDAYKKTGAGKAAPRPEIDSFSHVSEESKGRDKGLIGKKQSKSDLREQHEGDADAFAFENYLTAQMMNERWFGAETTPTSEYDDWVSGVDAVVEWDDDDGPLRLAVDFTAAERDEAFFKKTNKLEGNVKVKYLRSAVETADGQAKELSASMPIVLLGFDKSVFRHVAERGGGDVHRAVERKLLEQAAAQIDMQIIMTAQKVFEASRARRVAGGKEVRSALEEAGDDVTAEQVIDLVEELDAESCEVIFPKKHLSRFTELARLKKKIFERRQKALGEDSPDPETAQVFERSKTHNILSS